MQENSFIFNFKLILKFTAFVCLTAVIFFSAGNKYKEAADKNTVNAYTKSRFDDFYALPENCLDMVYVGSSHSYCTFDPEKTDPVLNLNSFQMGTPLQHADTTYFELLEIFKYQKPKYVVMEYYWDVLDDDFEPKQADSFFEVLRDENLKNQYISEVFPLGAKVKYILPAIRFQQEYFTFEGTEIKKDIIEKYHINENKTETNGTEYYRSKGYTYCDSVIIADEYDLTNQFKGFNGNKWEFSSIQQKYIEKISALCIENGSTLVFVTAPIANPSMEYIENYAALHNKLSSFAQSLDVAYLDFNLINQSEKLLKDKNFRDDAHLNDSGVAIVDNYFCRWFKENVMH